MTSGIGSIFSTFTTGLDIDADDVVVGVVGAILCPAFTDLIRLIFMVTPSLGAELTLVASAAGTCLRDSFVGGRPEEAGLKVTLGASLLADVVIVADTADDKAGAVSGGAVEALVGNGMRSFLANSDVRADAGTLPKLLRLVGPCRVSKGKKARQKLSSKSSNICKITCVKYNFFFWRGGGHI